MSNQLVVGDKAYIGSSVCTPKRKNMAQEGDRQGWMSRARKRIESSFRNLGR